MSKTSIPTVTLNDGNTLPVIGLSVTGLSPEQTHTAVTHALEAGYRRIDTAATHGNEEAVGQAIAQSGIARDELFITTKLATADQGFQSSQDAVRASLDRLGLSYVDLYLIGWPAERNGKYIDAWGGIMKARKDGAATSIGVSNFTTEHLNNIIDLTFSTPAVNHIELHPLLNQAEFRAFSTDRGIVTEAHSPLGGGNLLTNPTIAAIAAAHGKSAAQILIRWSIQLGVMVAARSAHPEHIAENIDVFDIELSAADMNTIDALNDGTRFCPNPDTYSGA